MCVRGLPCINFHCLLTRGVSLAAPRYINFNAYVQTCIWGTSFCTSAFNAFWLILRNIARIAAVTGVTHFLGLIGKISVVMGTAGRHARARFLSCKPMN